ncbi:hypothetical protein DB32_006762 [Sandaracinus amylolyticus]|uniref:Uncharacterized protein n=1 Tax=Sandaracinus amylolyticus TaxID=927083 RepID=A0A0F6YMS9_9BACT|nr:hypothetical protein DB32_006762 [Sandaracinus amylolyticus]
MRHLVVLLALVAGCAEPATFEHGILRHASSPRGCDSGDSATELLVTSDEIACPTAPSLPTRLHLYSDRTLDVGSPSFDMSRTFAAERCIDDVCVDVVGGTVETIDVDGDRVELRWSLELEDGTREEGSASIRVCNGSTGCL